MRYEVEVKFQKDWIEVKGKTIIVGVKSRPERGKANRELVATLANYFNIPQEQIRIITGFKSKRKIIEIRED